MTTSKFSVYVFVLAACIFGSDLAWAVYPPEPQSGGRFFPGKGTRAGGEYTDYIEDPDNSSYGRTENGNFERHHYAKGLELGIVRVRPTLGYVGEYDSNIFLTERGRKSDYISKLLGGVDADVLMDDGKYVLSGGVQTKSEWFARHGKQDHTDWSYQLGGGVHLESFDLEVHDNFRDTTDRNDSELTERIRRYENRLTGLATIPLGEFFSETEVTDFIVNFRDNDAMDLYDRHEFNVYPRIGMNIAKKTQALLEYGYLDINYKNQEDRDGAAHQGAAGVRGFLGEADLIAYELWGGWQFRHYESGDLKNFDGFIGHGQVTYKASAATLYTLKAIRRPEESLSAGQTFYTRNEISAQIRQQIAESWFATGRAGMGLSDYSNDRLDFLWEPAVGVEYVLPGKILALFTEYKFSGRESDAGNNDYSRHIASFGIKAEV